MYVIRGRWAPIGAALVAPGGTCWQLMSDESSVACGKRVNVLSATLDSDKKNPFNGARSIVVLSLN